MQLSSLFKTWFFPLLTIIFSIGLFFLDLPRPEEKDNYEKRIEAVVTEVQTHEESTLEGTETVQNLKLKFTTGDRLGEEIEIENQSGLSWDSHFFKENDKVLVVEIKAPGAKPHYFIADHIRRNILYALFGAFLLLVLLVAGAQGARAFLGMGFSFLVIMQWVLPLLLNGSSPLFATLSGAAVIIPITYGLSHGLEKKTLIAIIGTLIALLFSGALAVFSLEWAQLSGLADESALYLKSSLQIPIHFQNLLLAGILISLLGVLDDVTIAQTSVIQELVEAKPHIRFNELYHSAMQVGKDHITSMVNTMVLIYAGASLPLLLLFMTGGRTFTEVINYEFIAQQIIQTLIGSTGIILAVPLTTFIAALTLQKKEKRLE